MGYTHYWTQTADHKRDEWAVIVEDIKAIIEQGIKAGIPLANGMGDVGTSPEFRDDEGGIILLNGGEGLDHETFIVRRKRAPRQPWQRRRGSDFCKTAQKPYDAVVTAILCYLSTVAGHYSVSSDGYGTDFHVGLALARSALPRLANQLDVPMTILQADRWCGPWVTNESPVYTFRFCVDARAYVMGKEGTYCFPNHREAAEWAERHRDVFNPTGSFDQARWTRIRRQQSRLLGELVRSAEMFGRNQQPPAYVRREQIALPARAYYFRDLLGDEAA